MFLAYAQGATSYGFINLPTKTTSFMSFQKPAIFNFGPLSLAESFIGLMEFNNVRFELAMLPLIDIFTSSIYAYIEIVTWSLACYLPGKIASQWKRSHPYSLGVTISPILMLIGFLLTGGFSYITPELIFLGILVPLCVAGVIAISGLEGIPGAEEGALRWIFGRFFRRAQKVEEVAEKEETIEVEPAEVPMEEPVPKIEPESYQQLPEISPKVNDLIQLEESFTKNLGLSREEIFGRKILFEYDPVSEYENAVKDFCIQGLANRGLVMVFIRKGSAIYNALFDRAAIRFYCLTSQVSVPTEAARNEIWLPASDVSLMLDALNKTILSNPRASIWVVYDNLTELIFATGFEKTYG
ncbi:MAG: hypothetical protein ACUVTL_06490, partial [Thermoproteota archaeon]